MKKLMILSGLLIFFSCFLFSQNTTDPIDIRKGFKGGYYQKELRLNGKQLKQVLASNPAAEKKFNNSSGLYVVALLCAGAGGYMLGSGLGNAMYGVEGSGGLMLAGVAVAGVGIGLAVVVDKQRREAINMYNNGLNTSHYYPPQSYLKLNVSVNNIGISYNF